MSCRLLRCYVSQKHPKVLATRANTIAGEHPAAHRNIDWARTAIFLLTFGGLVIRLWHLGDRSLWFDEGASVQFATMPWREWLPFLWHGEANMLPYYLLLRLWLFL